MDRSVEMEENVLKLLEALLQISDIIGQSAQQNFMPEHDCLALVQTIEILFGWKRCMVRFVLDLF